MRQDSPNKFKDQHSDVLILRDNMTDWIVLQKSPASEPLNSSLLFAILTVYGTMTLSFFEGSGAI